MKRSLTTVQNNRQAITALLQTTITGGFMDVVEKSNSEFRCQQNSQQQINTSISKQFQRNFSQFDGKVSSMLQKEYQHEKEAPADTQEAIQQGPPAPFILEVKPVDTLMKLKRQFENESISVEFSVNNQPPLDEEQDLEEAQEQGQQDILRTTFNVYVIKGDVGLTFEMIYQDKQISVMHLSYEPKDGYEDNSTMYSGPIFLDLDEELQDSFQLYLNERGVTTQLADYIRSLINEKEQQEYVQWLQNVKLFIDKK